MAAANSDRNDSVYDREINSISRLEAALDAVRDEDLETKGTVEIDLYVKDGEITFICVTDVGALPKTTVSRVPRRASTRSRRLLAVLWRLRFLERRWL